MSAISFEAKLETIESLTVLRLPQPTSDQLPSRGLVMVNGTMNGEKFQSPLEPDGKGSHWFKVDEALQAAATVKAGDIVKLSIEPTKEWPEPDVPADVARALKLQPDVEEVWRDITPMARWDWIRWVRSTKNPATRARRIEVMCSKLDNGKRRACCFNRTECTDPAVSKGGILLEASDN